MDFVTGPQKSIITRLDCMGGRMIGLKITLDPSFLTSALYTITQTFTHESNNIYTVVSRLHWDDGTISKAMLVYRCMQRKYFLKIEIM